MPSQITDALWAELAPLVARAKWSRAGAPAAIPDRLFLEALLLADSGCKWRPLPERFGAWDVVYNRFRRWLAAGVFERLFADLPPAAAGRNDVRRVFIDSTTVRAHASAAGAPAAKGGGGTGPRAVAGRVLNEGPRRVHRRATAVAVVLTPGQAGDASAFDALWDQARPRAGRSTRWWPTGGTTRTPSGAGCWTRT